MERLRFLHIPKTAGSTFIPVLERQYRGKKLFSFTGDYPRDRKKFEALSADEREKIVLFTGHAPIVSGIKEADTATIITFLRDPISRVISYCQHVAEGKSPHLLKSFPPDSFDLDHFLNSGNCLRELSNLQTKMLINSGSCGSYELIESISAAEARDKALDNLFNKVAGFALQEYFDEGLVYFGSVLGWKAPLYYFSQNTKEPGKQIKFEERHLQRIAELNAIDIEVYRYAKQHFLNILNGPDFDKEKFKRLHRFNPLMAPLLRIGWEIKGQIQSFGKGAVQ